MYQDNYEESQGTQGRSRNQSETDHTQFDSSHAEKMQPHNPQVQKRDFPFI